MTSPSVLEILGSSVFHELAMENRHLYGLIAYGAFHVALNDPMTLDPRVMADAYAVRSEKERQAWEYVGYVLRSVTMANRLYEDMVKAGQAS